MRTKTEVREDLLVSVNRFKVRSLPRKVELSSL